MNTNNLPQKPGNAVWNAQENEWELGQKNAAGQYIGEWMWWLAPTNHLCCHTFFDDNGNMLSFTRFHPNGEVSRIGKYENGKEIEDIWYRCTEETTEFYADYYSPNKSWKAIKRIGKIPVEFDFYDKEGNHLNGKITLPENLINGPENETAKEALDRLQNTLNFLESQGKDLDNFNDNYKPVFKEKVTLNEIQEAEERLGIKFPKSYVDFVTTHGLFVLGEKNENYSALLEPSLISRLSDELESAWGVNWEDYSEEQKAIMDKIICFSNGDEGLQLTWFYCFDFNTLNSKTGQVTIVGYDQDDWEYLMEDEIEICEEKDAFDAHVKWIVNEAIQEIVEE
jgi:SMI1 / KNR4 family (SUKH-1)